jgi:malonyl CoA-acyl carrier protein transacylase
MKAYVFPGQGSQFTGMGKDLYEKSALAKEMMEKANEILGFRLTDIMFEGSEEDLKQTKVTQPAIFLHSVVLAACMGESFKPDMVAGHSLGEFSALVANKALAFEDALRLVSARALAMQKACEAQPSTMAAILGLEDSVVEEICSGIDGVVVAANYNCPGQLVISGEVEATCALWDGIVDIEIDIESDLRTLRQPVVSDIKKCLVEAITNSVRHGHADSMKISVLKIGSVARLEIQDNGVGFTNISQGLGSKTFETSTRSNWNLARNTSDNQTILELNFELDMPRVGVESTLLN